MVGQVFVSQLTKLSSTVVRPRFPQGWRYVGHDVMTWSAVCSSAPHSQAADGAIPHLHIVERKRRCFRGGKRIDPRPREHRDDKPTDAHCGLSICVISQLATRHKALVILLQETHCTSVDRLVIRAWASSA